MEKFRNLLVYQKAHLLVLYIYKITKKYPDDEKFGLVIQMRRAAISVAANIVEGSKRNGISDRKRFHNMSDTSLEELKYYAILSLDLNFIDKEESEKLIEYCREVGRMLHSLTQSL